MKEEHSNLLALRGMLKGLCEEKGSTDLDIKEFLDIVPSKHFPNKEALLSEAIKLGLIEKSGEDTVKASLELVAERFKASVEVDLSKDDKEEEDTEEEPEKSEGIKETKITEDDKPKFDGPGEYYHMIIRDIGFVLVRTETHPKDWNRELVHFDNFWTLKDEEPVQKVHKDEKTGREFFVRVPRFRISKAKEGGAWIPFDNICMIVAYSREDNLVQYAMRFEEAILQSGGD